jgi:predicted HNH restriction endonuclease
MTLLTKKPKEDVVSLARWATLNLNLDEILKAQREANIIAHDLVRAVNKMTEANKEFVNVIQNFFAIEKKLRIEDAMRREKKEQDFEPSKADLKY